MSRNIYNLRARAVEPAPAAPSSFLPQAIDMCLQRFCPDPPVLGAAIAGLRDLKRRTLRQDQQVSVAGEEASDLWIVGAGRLGAYHRGRLVAEYGTGDMVGEEAFAAEFGRNARHTNDVWARERSELWSFGWSSLLEALDDHGRAVLMETVSRTLAAKLDEAQVTDVRLSAEVDQLDALLANFVCEHGLAAVRAQIGVSGDASAYRHGTFVVWFSDLSGFTRAVAETPPRAVATLLTTLLGPQCDAIRANGGQIDKLMGDGIMAWWPVPTPAKTHETTAAAVRAALAAADGVCQAARSLGQPIGVRIGLNLGEATLGNFGAAGRIAFTAVGRTVNDAARLEQARRDDTNHPLPDVRISPSVMDGIRQFPDIISQFEPEPRRLGSKPGEPARYAHVRRVPAA